MDQVKPQWRYPAIILPCLPTLQRQNAENLKQIFPEKEYRGLSPNFHIHVSVSELYFPTMGLPFLLEEILYVDRSWEYIDRSQTHECGNWGWGRAIPRKEIYKRNCRCSVYKTCLPQKFVCFRLLNKKGTVITEKVEWTKSCNKH